MAFSVCVWVATGRGGDLVSVGCVYTCKCMPAWSSLKEGERSDSSVINLFFSDFIQVSNILSFIGKIEQCFQSVVPNQLNPPHLVNCRKDFFSEPHLRITQSETLRRGKRILFEY